MYDFSDSEELRNFFNVNPDFEPFQRFILHNREEVTSFETMLNRHVETETHLPFHRFNLMMNYIMLCRLVEVIEDNPKINN